MKVQSHCFVFNAKIEPLPEPFKFDGYDVVISNTKQNEREGLMLEITKPISIDEIVVSNEVQDEQGVFIAKRMRPYIETLTKITQLIEGFLVITHREVPLKFDAEKIVVNIIGENAEEIRLLESGAVTRGFGSIIQPIRFPIYTWSEKIKLIINKASEHIPALSFLAQAVRSQDKNDQEIAFFLYFRIIDGYFSDGAKDVENKLLKKESELSKYIKYTETIKMSTYSILSELGLPSKSKESYTGLISDIVHIRHKLTHFSKSNARNHYVTKSIPDLNVLNLHLRQACTLILWDKIGMK